MIEKLRNKGNLIVLFQYSTLAVLDWMDRPLACNSGDDGAANKDKLAVTKGKNNCCRAWFRMLFFNWPVFGPQVFVFSVSASISLVRAKVGWYVLFLAKVILVCVVVCDVGKPIALLLSTIQCTAKGRSLLESVSVSGISPSCKESKFILSPNSKIWSTFSAVQ